MNKSRGFTIIELIVVIAIIAILAAIVMVSVTQYIQKSKDAAIIADMKQISTIAVGYLADNENISGLYMDSKVINLEKSIMDINNPNTCAMFFNKAGYSQTCKGANNDYGFYHDVLVGSNCSEDIWAFILSAYPSGNGYCTDSSGYFGLTTSADPASTCNCTGS